MKASIHSLILIILAGLLFGCCHTKSVYYEAQAVKCIVEKEIPSITHPEYCKGPAGQEPEPFPADKIPRVIFLSCNPSPNISIALPENYTGIPPSEWLKVMSKMTIPVKSIACATYSKEGNYVKDKETGQPGTIVNIYDIQWDSDRDVRMEAGITYGVLYGHGVFYKLNWSMGKWHIIEENLGWLE